MQLFTRADPKSGKKYSQVVSLFCVFGIFLSTYNLKEYIYISPVYLNWIFFSILASYSLTFLHSTFCVSTFLPGLAHKTIFLNEQTSGTTAAEAITAAGNAH